jgi:hypothetical protein
MALGMFLPPIAGGIVEGGWPRRSPERPIVPDIGPNPPGIGLGLRQDRHGRVIAVYAIGGKHKRFDQSMQGPHDRGASADLVGKR